MTKKQQNFEIWSGDHHNLRFSVTQDDGSGKSLSGACVVWVLHPENISGSILRKSTVDGITVSGSQFTVALDPADTVELNGHYYHQAQVTDSASIVSTVAVGTGIINKSGVQ